MPPRAGAVGVPPGAVFELHPSVTLSEEYTNNFNLRESREENFRTAISPGGLLLINGAFLKGLVGYTLSVAHDSSREDVEPFHSFNGSVTWAATPRFSITLTDALTRSDDPSQSDRLRVRRDRELFTSNVFSAATQYSTDRISTGQYYRMSIFSAGGSETTTHALGANAGAPFGTTNTASLGYEYLLSESDGSDVAGHSVNAAVSRRLTELATAGISGGVNFRSGQDSRGRDNDFTIVSVNLFGTYTLPRRLSLSSSVGASQLRGDRGSDQTTFSTNTTLTYQFARATASLTAEQGFSETFALGEDTGVVETRGVTGSLSYPFTPFVSGTASGFYRQNDSPRGQGDDRVGQGRSRRDEQTWGGSATLDVMLLRWLTMVFEYGYTHGTTGGDEAFTENRVRLSLTASF